ncbi:MAG: hypothetical protein LBE76_01135 [Nitrososphaerota archaeon]|nr:hypothetical protein [Nitrososphaerota archaeon]
MDVAEADFVTVVISKLDYARLNIKVEIHALGNSTVMLFPNDTSKELPFGELYTFTVDMPPTVLFGNSQYSFQTEGINLSSTHPVDVTFNTNSTNGYLTSPKDEPVDVYWFIIQGNAAIRVNGLGVGF